MKKFISTSISDLIFKGISYRFNNSEEFSSSNQEFAAIFV